MQTIHATARSGAPPQRVWARFSPMSRPGPSGRHSMPPSSNNRGARILTASTPSAAFGAAAIPPASA